VLQGLVHARNLRSLRVQAAGVGVVEVDKLLDAVQALTSLQVLDLGSALDCAYCVGAMLASVSKLQRLRLLDLSNCRVGPAFAVNLAQCLSNISTIEKVDVSGNELSYSGVHALATVLQWQPRVEVLDIAGSAHLYQTDYIQLGQNFPFVNW
jgi:Ran GTPase-activating protein (RanGAP) involved in mRNA processing and transport